MCYGYARFRANGPGARFDSEDLLRRASKQVVCRVVNSVADLLGRATPIEDMTSDDIMRPCDGRLRARSILTSNVT